MSSLTYVKLSNNLKCFREKKALSVADLAFKTNSSCLTIDAIESCNYVPSVTLALLLSCALDCSVEDLFHFELHIED